MVHSGIGGEMRRPVASPNDPLFFMHHVNVDRLWWLWVQNNTAARTYDFGGLEYGGVQGTLDTKLEMLGYAPNKLVRDVMSTQNDLLCYRY
jgi:tyrosinase